MRPGCARIIWDAGRLAFCKSRRLGQAGFGVCRPARHPLELGTIIVGLSQPVLEAHRRDDEFVLFRGEHSNQPGSPSVFLLAPASMQPALETLKKIEHESSFSDELYSLSA